MTLDEQVNNILKENEKRTRWLNADYDPVTGKGAPGERELLHIPDFAIPKQYVPKRMLKNQFVHEIVKAGSIKKFLNTHPDDEIIKTPHDVEITLRRIRHKYDYFFWAYFCFPILSKEFGEIRFKLNRPQMIVMEEILDMIEKEVPIDVIIVKARQWGGSTLCMSVQTWIATKLDNYHSFAVAAQVNGAAENILRMLKYAVSKYPSWDLGLAEGEPLHLAPAGKSGNAYVIKDSKDEQVLPASIYIGSVERPDSLRSPAVRGAHYSEVGVWKDTEEFSPAGLIASISGGILKRPLTMQVMESTAKSTDDFFHDVYIAAKQNKSSYRPVFIPWFYIPHDTIPIKNKKKFIRELLEHKDDDKPYGRWLDAGKHYWWLWNLGASLEGINWYKYKRLDYTTYAQMANEAPSTDIEAFQAAGIHVFDVYQVEALRQFCRPAVKHGMLISSDRRDRGVIQDIKFIEQSNGPLEIWEMPDNSPISNRYVVSVDIGGPNSTSDFHAVRVFDRFLMHPDFAGGPTVVAQMHYHCSRDDLVYDAVRLAAWYNNALLVIESNTLEMSDKSRVTEGDGSQYVLDVAADIYWHMYTRETPVEQIMENTPKKYGFQTNAKTKPLIIDLMQWAIREQAWDEPDEKTIDELSLYKFEDNKMTAPRGKHDDLLMATAIGLYICFKEMPLPEYIKSNKSKKITTITKGSIANF